jgi:hypothetical protein
LEGDGRVEAMVLSFIKHRYGAENLFYLPPHVAREILKRPADFIQAAKQHCEPELFTTFHVAISEGGRA